MNRERIKIKLRRIILGALSIAVPAVAVLSLFDKPAMAQEEFVPGAAGFIDEDGDGFNDLLPDSDADGIPDALDPDFKGHKADSIYMHNQNQAENRNMWQHMNEMQNQMEHGEPGMFGPGDSTMHGGMHDGDQGGHHGGGGMGPGGGSPPDGGGMNSNESGMDSGGESEDQSSDEGSPGHGGHDGPEDGDEGGQHGGGPGGG